MAFGLVRSYGLQFREHVSEEQGRYPCLTAQRATDHGEQVLDWLALGHPAGDADPDCLNDLAFPPTSGRHDNPDVRVAAQCLIGEPEPVLPVNLDIEQQDVEPAVGEHPARLFDRRRGEGPHPGLDVQPARERLGERDVGVQDEASAGRWLPYPPVGQDRGMPHQGGSHPLAAAAWGMEPNEYWPAVPSTPDRATMLVASNRE